MASVIHRHSRSRQEFSDMDFELVAFKFKAKVDSPRGQRSTGLMKPLWY